MTAEAVDLGEHQLTGGETVRCYEMAFGMSTSSGDVYWQNNTQQRYKEKLPKETEKEQPMNCEEIHKEVVSQRPCEGF